jgi:hypothetical protein
MLLLVLGGGIVPFLAIFALERDDVLRHRVLLVSFFVLGSWRVRVLTLTFPLLS